MKTNRWLNGAIPAVGIHISIGAVYAWVRFYQSGYGRIGRLVVSSILGI